MEIAKHIITGLKGLVVSIIAGIVAIFLRGLAISVGIAVSNTVLWALVLIFVLLIGLYVWGWFADKFWRWK